MEHKEEMQKSLEKAIMEWAMRQSEGKHWIDGYVTEQTDRLMASAAMAVLEATDEVQWYMQAEGLLK